MNKTKIVDYLNLISSQDNRCTAVPNFFLVKNKKGEVVRAFLTELEAMAYANRESKDFVVYTSWGEGSHLLNEFLRELFSYFGIEDKRGNFS